VLYTLFQCASTYILSYQRASPYFGLTATINHRLARPILGVLTSFKERAFASHYLKNGLCDFHAHQPIVDSPLLR
jgi:hypothetical protein